MSGKNWNVGFTDMQAATAFYNGLVQVDQYDTIIEDHLRRSGVMGRRITKRIASGDPSRWVIQTAFGAAQFSDKRTLAFSAQTPTRTEGAVTLKAITGEIKFGLYNQLLGQVMPANFNTKAQDLSDMIGSLVRLHDKAIWTGTDTVDGSLVGAGSSTQYVSVPTQISTTLVTIASTASIISTIRTQVAKLMASETYEVRPSAIYCHPQVIDFIEQEWIAAGNNTLPQVEVVPGIRVSAIRTAAGDLPLIPDPYLAANPSWASSAPSGQTNYPFAICDESMIEYHHLPGTDRPMLFQLGQTTALENDYVAVMFGGLVVKGGSVAHLKGVIQRATV